MTKTFFALLTTVALVLTSACSTRFTSPGDNPGGGSLQLDAIAVISWDPKDSPVCKNENPKSPSCDRTLSPPMFVPIAFPSGYAVMVELKLQNGIYTGQARIPYGNNLKVAIYDRFQCVKIGECGTDVTYTGLNISINGKRLPDGKNNTTFSFSYPDSVLTVGG